MARAQGAVAQDGGADMDAPAHANGLAAHFEPEGWAVYAAREIAAAPYHQPGRCFYPDCSKPFRVAREWQIYCCAACRDADLREARRWGHRAAQPLLVWRMYKYSTDPAQAALARAARRYVTLLQSAWCGQRHARMARAMGEDA
ncbi:hypothetical protein SAMN04488103_109175 [Gemmobacter aquatilis]|uniref:Uncharacterized protein n=1 Tax=Gemmobacter aquatilis TaxID=933059 RepID=A0A1H8KS82_9RHOB|nr:hypothetical protein [Gemmobacter aquatilis]SEN95268.1 hypothetical protein SAMN04488103_109175 [Gemmobacter aquatilis]